MDAITHLLHLGSSNLLRPQIHEHQMVIRTSRGQTVTLLHQIFTQRLGVSLNLQHILLELRFHNLNQLSCNASNLVNMRTPLTGGEDSVVDRLLNQAFAFGSLLLEEYHSRAGTTQTFVGGGGHEISVLERIIHNTGSDQTGDVGHVHQQIGTDGIRNFTELGVIPLTGVGRTASDQQLRHEDGGSLGKGIEIDGAVLAQAVWHGLEVNRTRRHLLLGSVETVGQVPAVGEIETH
mmetsp:Transcript_56900/g.101542  ORF Transcript_56900/g.101542 Transcript_56900/m.101542 type:complete len:235 (+) Transcript_56900:767-1471(+)